MRCQPLLKHSIQALVNHVRRQTFDNFAHLVLYLFLHLLASIFERRLLHDPKHPQNSQ